MSDLSGLSQAIAFGARLYRQRAGVAYAGYLRRDPMALLQLGPGRDNPYAIYDRIRESGPLVPTRLGNWVTPSHRVCGSVLRDRRFGVAPADGAEAADGGQDDLGLSFLQMNPPDHSRLRRLGQPAFSPAAVAAYRGQIEATVGDLLDRARADGEFDLVSALAAPLPIAVITGMLGIPDAGATEFSRYGTVIGSALDGIRSLRHAGQLQASDAALRRLFESLFELRRREPRDDIVSRLVAAEGEQIQPGEMLPMCILLLVAGFETTVNLIGNAVLALLGQPGQWQALCADPATMAPLAVEEALRFDPPVQRTGRIALESLELDGQAVHRGQFVVTLIGAAGRDPEAYDHPDAFDIRRAGAADHLAFSGASTTASGPRWPAWRPRSRCSCWLSGCPGCGSPAPSAGATPPRCAGRSACQWPPAPGGCAAPAFRPEASPRLASGVRAARPQARAAADVLWTRGRGGGARPPRPDRRGPDCRGDPRNPWRPANDRTSPDADPGGRDSRRRRNRAQRGPGDRRRLHRLSVPVLPRVRAFVGTAAGRDGG